MRRILVRTAGNEYPVVISATLATGFAKLPFPPPEKRHIYILTSPDIWALWGKAFLDAVGGEPVVLFLPPGERSKRLAEIERLSGEMTAAGADRSALLLAFGGGVIGDVGGFLAAIYMRGIGYMQVPTTLLAQVDSSVGGKTGVNLRQGKNLIGSFHHPLAVVAATEVLSTLPARQLRSGLYESIKAGLIRKPALFRLIEAEREGILAGDAAVLEKVIAASVGMKTEVVGLDERESGLRMILNFGHTIGHAIETVGGYGELLHGEAVAWGMLAALNISRKRGWLVEEDWARADRLIRFFNPDAPRWPDSGRLLRAAASDKKNRSGKRRFILLKGIGKAVVTEDVTDREIVDAIKELASGLTAASGRESPATGKTR